jgi:ribonuclease PH
VREGRPPEAMRPVHLTVDVLAHPLASCEARVGGTRVIAAVNWEDKCPPHRRGSGEGWVTAEYGLLPAATHTRGVRESVRGRPSGRSQEISRLIGRVARSVVHLPALGERTLIVDCDVLDADGGTRAASLTAAAVALVLADRRLRAQRVVAEPLLRQRFCGVSAGIVDGEPRLDLDYDEDSRAEVDLNVAFAADGRIVEIQGTGERRPVSREELARLLDLAWQGAVALFAAQEAALAGAREEVGEA